MISVCIHCPKHTWVSSHLQPFCFKNIVIRAHVNDAGCRGHLLSFKQSYVATGPGTCDLQSRRVSWQVNQIWHKSLNRNPDLLSAEEIGASRVFGAKCVDVTVKIKIRGQHCTSGLAFCVGLWLKTPQSICYRDGNMWEFMFRTLESSETLFTWGEVCVCVCVCVCVRESGNTGRQCKHSLAQQWLTVMHAVTLHSILRRLKVAHSPRNILRTYKDADGLDFQLSRRFWGLFYFVQWSHLLCTCGSIP